MITLGEDKKKQEYRLAEEGENTCVCCATYDSGGHEDAGDFDICTHKDKVVVDVKPFTHTCNLIEVRDGCKCKRCTPNGLTREEEQEIVKNWRGAISHHELKQEVEDLTSKLNLMADRFDEVVTQVKIKGLRPTREEILRDEYSGVDLMDMIILLTAPDYDLDDKFFEAWNALVKMSDTSEVMDSLRWIKEHDDDGAYDDEYQQLFEELLTRQPYELFKKMMDAFKTKLNPLAEKIDEAHEGISPELTRFKEWVYHLFRGLHVFLVTKYPDDKPLIELLDTMARQMTGYKP